MDEFLDGLADQIINGPAWLLPMLGAGILSAIVMLFWKMLNPTGKTVIIAVAVILLILAFAI